MALFQTRKLTACGSCGDPAVELVAVEYDDDVTVWECSECEARTEEPTIISAPESEATYFDRWI